jgi:hypothetical protein
VCTLAIACFFLFSDGPAVERMILSDAPYARSHEERNKIETVAAATRLGIEYNPSLIYMVAAKMTANGFITLSVLCISTTILLLFYSDMNGSLWEYGFAFIHPLWLLAIANLINVALKLLLCRTNGSISVGLIFRPFDWTNIWQIFTIKTDIFFLAYVIMAGIGCAATAKIPKIEGIMMVVFVWLVIYFGAMILGIEPIVSM